MPKRKQRIPTYRLHKPSGQAIVTLSGRDIYLGRHGTKISLAEYDRRIAEWLAGGRRMPTDSNNCDDPTIIEVLAAYWKHAKVYYQRDGKPTSEITYLRESVRVLKRLYGSTLAKDFTPTALMACRTVMVNAGLARSSVNGRVHRIKRLFKWGASNGMVPAEVYHALTTVEGLRRGRTKAREPEPVKPVPNEYVDAIRLHVSRQVWAMVELQRLTGMRSGEVTIMRGCDLDTSGPIWLYRPESHKTEHHGHERVVEIGPKAQKIIRPFLKPDVEAFLFSPIDAEAERRANNHRKRRTPMSCGNRPGSNCKRRPKREPQERYTSDSYRRAITRGCDLADKAAKKAANESGQATDSEKRIIPQWHPHQLRHNFGTRVRREYGIETARILLGHHSVPMAELYSEVDRGRAREIMSKIG